MLWILTIFILILVLILLFAFFIHQKLQNPTCGANISSTSQYCSDGQIIRKTTPTSCDPTNDAANYHNMSFFFEYITRVYLQESTLQSDLENAFGKENVFKGNFIFAIPEILRILTSDFGNNASTPYGMMSFLQTYMPCISQKTQFCQNLNPGETNSAYQILVSSACSEYINLENKIQKPCPFVINDSNPNILIQNLETFNNLGALGSISLNYNQSIVLKGTIPLSSLHLNYWSFNLYLTDSFNPNVLCAPYEQVYAASIAPPLNAFTSVSISGKKFNPLTGQGCLVEGQISFYIIVACEATLASQIQSKLDTSSVDFMYVYKVPVSPNSAITESSLPNPNQIQKEDAMFHPEYQRLNLFLRLSPNPRATATQLEALKQFVYRKENLFQVSLVQQTLPSSPIFFKREELPTLLPPPYNEQQNLKIPYHDICKKVRKSLSSGGYSNFKLKTRNSLLNIMAPLYHSVLKTKLPYKGGWQAIQLAGNAQADNYDANYFLSQSACLTDNDALVSISVNHSALGNGIYNSINIVDTNKAYGYNAVVLDRTYPYLYYVILIGRSASFLVQTESRLKQQLKGLNVFFEKIIITTGDSIYGEVPLCHLLTQIERVYLNTVYSSSSNPNQIYNLTKLFGDNLNQLLTENNDQEDVWKSLSNVVGCDPSTLIHTTFYKTTYLDPKTTYARLAVLFMILVLIVIFVISIYLIIRTKKPFKESQKK